MKEIKIRENNAEHTERKEYQRLQDLLGGELSLFTLLEYVERLEKRIAILEKQKGGNT